MPIEQPTLILNGELEIVRITADLFDQAVELFKNFFMKYENISIVLNLNGSEQTIAEMEILVRAVLKDEISFAARDVKTKRFAAMACNKLFTPATDFERVFSVFKTPNMAAVREVLERMEGTYNLFKEWNIDCLLEIVFLSTHTDYSGRGLATILSQHSIEFARKMLHGKLTESQLKSLPEDIRNLKPKAITSVLTAKFSQRVGEKCGLQNVLEVPYTDFEYNGKKYSEKLDPIHKTCTYAALRLE